MVGEAGPSKAGMPEPPTSKTPVSKPPASKPAAAAAEAPISKASASKPPTTKVDEHPASTFGDEQTVTFLDHIPPEIRMQIYGYVLEEEKPIELKIIVLRLGMPREVARVENHRSRNHRGEVWDKKERKWTPAPPSHTAILRVNKQIHAEASQALYGMNIFRLRSTTVLEELLLLLDKRAQHLRSIEIEQYFVTTAPRAFRLLGQKAKGLRNLRLGHSNFCGRTGYRKPLLTMESIASDATELLKDLQASYEAQGLTTDVLDVLSIAGPGECYECRFGIFRPQTHYRHACIRSGGLCGDLRYCGCICANAYSNTQRLNAELRSQVAEKLGISDEASKSE